MVLVEVKAGVPLQLLLFGPKRLNVIVPVGATPFESVATSETVPLPRLIDDGEAVVVSEGEVLPTVTVSPGALHAEVAVLLLPSPL
jgi:hypothetical protein